MPIVETEDRGAVRHIVLNRPDKRNALNGELILGLGDAFAAAAAERSVHCVVVRGAGAMFSSGADLSGLSMLAEQPSSLRAFRAAAAEKRLNSYCSKELKKKFVMSQQS